jgi:DNA-binding NarL/FixJ family response regulator
MMHPAKEQIRVVVVDDLAFMRRALALLLEEEGVIVSAQANNAPEAITAIESTQPHAVLLDLMLGDGESLSLIPKLKQKQPDLAVVVISGSPPHSFQSRAMDAGASAIFVKGQPPSLLAEILRRVTDNKQAH